MKPAKIKFNSGNGLLLFCSGCQWDLTNSVDPQKLIDHASGKKFMPIQHCKKCLYKQNKITPVIPGTVHTWGENDKVILPETVVIEFYEMRTKVSLGNYIGHMIIPYDEWEKFDSEGLSGEPGNYIRHYINLHFADIVWK